MSRNIPNRPAAEQAYRELSEKFQVGTTVELRSRPEWRGAVSTDIRRSISIERMASGYALMVFVAWDRYPPSWTYADDLTVIAPPPEK